MQRWLSKYRYALIFWLCFGILRTSLADWNPILSSSMRPTLVEGGMVLVNRVAYDLKLPLTDITLVKLDNPQRGDVVTFTSPKDGVRRIKRIPGIPGDTLQMKDEVLWVSDNRDNSADSRYIGLVPRRLLIGHAHHILASAQILDHGMPRFRRFGAPIL